jgi:hypothetical protein
MSLFRHEKANRNIDVAHNLVPNVRDGEMQISVENDAPTGPLNGLVAVFRKNECVTGRER